MTDKTETTILLDIYERLGVIEQQMRWLTKSHEKMDGELDELREFRSKVGAYIWLGGALVSGVFIVLGQGLKYALDKWLH